MNLTQKQKKILGASVAGGVLLLAHFGSGILDAVHPVHASAAKPNPTRPVCCTSVRNPVLPPLPPDPNASLKQASGVWLGETTTKNGGSCKLRLELDPKPADPSGFTGESSISCADNLGELMREPVGNRLLKTLTAEVKPAAGIFSGKADNGTIDLTLENLITDSANGCHPTEFIIRPFGQANLAANYQQNVPDKQCEPGGMILRRAR